LPSPGPVGGTRGGNFREGERGGSERRCGIDPPLYISLAALKRPCRGRRGRGTAAARLRFRNRAQPGGISFCAGAGTFRATRLGPGSFSATKVPRRGILSGEIGRLPCFFVRRDQAMGGRPFFFQGGITYLHHGFRSAQTGHVPKFCHGGGGKGQFADCNNNLFAEGGYGAFFQTRAAVGDGPGCFSYLCIRDIVEGGDFSAVSRFVRENLYLGFSKKGL